MRSGKVHRGKKLKIQTYERVRVWADSTSMASADSLSVKDSMQPEVASANVTRNDAPETKQPTARSEKEVGKPAKKAASANAATTYTVRRGDNLSKIAKRFGTTVAAIQKANSMSGTRIDIGDKLKIPARRR